MLKYTVSYQTPTSQLIDFQLDIDNIKADSIKLQLPAWRPGRYTLQNFAKNIHAFSVENAKGKPVSFQKITKDCWEVNTKKTEKVFVKYTYHASQMDAGGTWLDENQLYINWITCGLSVSGRENEAYSLDLQTPTNYEFATNLPLKKGKFISQNFHELVDSPIVASPNLQHKTYKVANCKFHIWIQGNCQPDWEKLISDFKAFTKVQIHAFGGEFPTNEYHFIFQILPYRHYHGVEHKHSTVITLGPEEDFHTAEFYNNLIGVSSHELYHTWNVTRLRSKELIPYNYSEENYTRAGFVLEGITTYYGDLMLRRANIGDDEYYLKELGILMRRHFHNTGRSNYSLADSSFDLWLDGYTSAEPNRTVSIYVKGALCAILLDLTIRELTKNKNNLDDVMLKMWKKFGKNGKGYIIQDYRTIVEEVAGKSMKSYFDKYIFGTADLFNPLKKAFDSVGLSVKRVDSEKSSERNFGIKLQDKQGKVIVASIDKNSTAYNLLTLGDEIVAIDNKRATIGNIDKLLADNTRVTALLFRNNLFLTKKLKGIESQIFNNYILIKKTAKSKNQKQRLKLWFESAV
ncbi:MAG: putative metalloprotease with PDZ domain [Arenicella sp.]|jgi:predicted metalloprotease with PDZ domain